MPSEQVIQKAPQQAETMPADPTSSTEMQQPVSMLTDTQEYPLIYIARNLNPR